MLSVFGLVLILALAAAWIALARTSRSKGPATERELERLGLTADEDARVLVGRWRDRARRWRTIGGLPALTFAVVASMAIRAEVRVGIGDAPLWSDPLVMGLLGAFAGAIAAELHHVRSRPSGPRTVSLRPRELSDHLPRKSHLRLIVLAILAVAGVVAQLAAPAARGFPLPGLMAVAMTAVVPLVQRAIVTRPRPALADGLASADDAVRRLAIRSVDAAGAGLVLLLTLWQLSAVTSATVPDGATISFLIGLAYLAATVVALVWWWRGGPLTLMSSTVGSVGSSKV